jgi:chorismate mutase/prephenate dehydratase
VKALNDVRNEIDGIDDELARLIRRRLDLAGEVADAKRKAGIPVCDPARERAILTKVTEAAGADSEQAMRLLFTTLFNVSKARQRVLIGGEAPVVTQLRAATAAAGAFPTRAVVACPGTEGSYAQQAVSLLFPVPTILYFNSFEKVFEAVEKGLCPYGILPVENSAVGSVASVFDLMVKHRFHIARAVRVKVDHVLLGLPGATLDGLREIESHPHALAQCSGFLKSRPAITAVPGSNTALAADALAKSGRTDRAVIASRACAELYGLKVLAENVADAAYNYTRFICISRDLEVYADANKFSLMMSLPHRPGALNGIIAKFAAIGVNLTKLESRPIPGMDFEFRFTFDFESAPTNPAATGLISELAQDPEIEHFTFLGAFAEN